ncbi:MAG: S41 family peptidase [Saprospiraceae bacterium]|nr:S41 family peptidase [Saprospiraceae bacterium]
MEKQSSKQNWKVWLPLLISVTLVFGILLGMRLPSSQPAIRIIQQDDLKSNTLGSGKVEELIRYIEAKYVDPVDREKLLNDAIASIMDDLDPHSNYYSASDAIGVKESLEGKFDGIGIEFMIIDDTIMVLNALEDGPSWEVGIRSGDKMIAIQDSLVAGVGITSDQIMDRLRGEKGTTVDVQVLDAETHKIVDYTVTRDRIPSSSVETAIMLDDKTGFIKLSRFTAQTYEEFMQGLENLVENHQMENLIVDLRQNPGGYLQETTQILSQLFNENDRLLVYTEGRTSPRKDFETTGRPFFNVGRMVVLIDEGSASASEILAGAVQDNDRGVLVGRRSFGKGLVQERYTLSDGSEIHLTVARYYTPSGRSIQKSYSDKSEYIQDVAERYLHGEMLDRDSIKILDSTEYFTLSGRPVYGGGGIVPDVFVPIDTLMLSETYLLLRQQIPAFVFRYLEGEGAQFTDMSEESFIHNYRISETLFQQFMSFAAAKIDRFVPNEDDIHRAGGYLKQDLLARMGHQLYGPDAFYAISNAHDPDVQTALQLIGRPEAQWRASIE